jgi:hypothetical protein
MGKKWRFVAKTVQNALMSSMERIKNFLTLNLLYVITAGSYRVNAGWLACHAYAHATKPFLKKDN